MCFVENRSSQKNPEVLYCEEGDFQLDRVSNPPPRPPACRPRLLSREYAVCMFVPPSLCPCPGGRDRNGGPVCSFYVPPALLWSRMMECTSRAKASGAPRALYIIVRIYILCICLISTAGCCQQCVFKRGEAYFQSIFTSHFGAFTL